MNYPGQSERDWREDWEGKGELGGCYENRCCTCRLAFFGHKRRTICKVCREKQAPVVTVGAGYQHSAIGTPSKVHLVVNVVHADGTTGIRTIPSLAGVELKSRLDEYRQHQIGTSGLSVPYNKMVEYLDSEVQRLVQEFLKGLT